MADTGITSTGFILILRFSRTALFPSVKDSTPSDTLNSSSTVSTPGQMSVDSLLALRENIFSKVEKCFDPFASPMLFFRTPSSDLPDRGSNRFPNDVLSGRTLSALDSGHTLEKRRRSHRKYPPANHRLRFPALRVDVAEQSVLKDQCSEFIELLRKSALRSDEKAINEDSDTVKQRFTLFERSGLHIWDKRQFREIGQWFGDQFRS